MGVTDATASEFVDRVERRGLAIRTHRADDRRVVDCKLSDDGARLLAEIAGARQAAMRQVLAILTTEDPHERHRWPRRSDSGLAQEVRLAARTQRPGSVGPGGRCVRLPGPERC